MSALPPMRASVSAHTRSSSYLSPLSSCTQQPLLQLLPSTPPGRNPIFAWFAITTWRAKPLFARLRSRQDLYSSFPLKNRLSGPGSEEDDEEDDDEQDSRDVSTGEYDVASSDQDAGEGGDEEEEEDQDEEEVMTDSAVASTSGFEIHKRQRVARFLSDVREFGDSIIDFRELAGIYDFPIDKFQRLAIQAFLGRSSVVVSAPTSSGKTLIAEAAAAATVAKGRRFFYTTPLKALSNQKYRDFRETFGESCVGLLTGDSAVNKDAQILIMTTEILRNMLYQSVGTVSRGSGLSQVDVIILDEVHYLSDISRGTVWEEIVIYCPKDVQLICLSATVANADELAGWMDTIHGKTELITTNRRPVPLSWHFSLKNCLSPLLDKKGSRMNRKLSLGYLQVSNLENEALKENGARRSLRKRRNDSVNDTSATNISRCAPLSKNDINFARRSQVPQIRDTIQQLKARNMLPAIWFIFSRKGCDAAVQYLESLNLLDECESSEVALALNRFKIQYPDAVRESSIRGLLQGVAAHHAGCLPLWKSFVEELFQQGLLKVVFATETLAAGINMPARTAVISSISKRNESGRALLSSNELQQMAGRAGRRGIDKEGYVVLIQTAYEGAEECCDVLFSGLEPLVSQFKASYGMVLNLLAGEKLTHRAKESDEVNTIHSGRTLDEARKLIEQSFGNYVGSSVMLAAKEELRKIQHEIDYLSSEVTNEAIDRKCQEQLSNTEYCEISILQEKLKAEKWKRTVIRRRMELKRMAGWKPILNECYSGQLPFICLQYNDNGVHKIVPAVYLTSLQPLEIPQIFDMINLDSLCTNTMERNGYEEIDGHSIIEPYYYIALGSDNSWYLFTEKWIRTVYKTGFPDVPSGQDGDLPRKTLRDFIAKNNLQWEKLAHSEFGGLWCAEGSLETWSWSLNIPILSSLSDEDELKPWTEAYQDDVELYREQKSKVSYLKKQISATNGFKEFKKIIDMARFSKEKIERLEARSNRLIRRIDQIEPSGWKEFLQLYV